VCTKCTRRERKQGKEDDKQGGQPGTVSKLGAQKGNRGGRQATIQILVTTEEVVETMCAATKGGWCRSHAG